MEEKHESKSMDVKERRKKVEGLHNGGIKEKRIAKILGIPIRVVERDLDFLARHNRTRDVELSVEVQEEIRARRPKKSDTSIEITREKTKSEKIAERREKVARLYSEGKSAKKIAEELGVSYATIYQDIRLLREEGTLEKSTRKKRATIGRVAERRDRVARLYSEGKSVKEIVEELGVSYDVIYRDIETLAEEGKVEELTGRKKKEISERRREVARLYSEGKTAKEIAAELEISYDTIRQDIKVLTEEGTLEKRDGKGRDIGGKIAERREKVARLYREGKLNKEIVEELGVSNFTVGRDIKALIEEGKIEKRDGSLIRRKRSKRTTERRAEVERLYNEGKSVSEIAEELGVTRDVIYLDIKALAQEGKVEGISNKKDREKAERRKELERLYNEGKSVPEIAEKFGLSRDVIYQDIRLLIKEGMLGKRDRKKRATNAEVAERRKEAARLYNEGKSVPEIAEKFGVSRDVIYQDIRLLIKQGIIEKTEKRRKSRKVKKGKISTGKKVAMTTSKRELHRKMEELQSEGNSYGEIADALNVSIVEVVEYLESLVSKVSEDKSERQYLDRKTRVKKLFDSGKTTKEIAEELKIPENLVREDLLLLGIIPGLRVVPSKETDKEKEKRKNETARAKELTKPEETSQPDRSKAMNVKERRAKVGELYSQGIEKEEVAKRLEISINAVSRDIEFLLAHNLIGEKTENAGVQEVEQIPDAKGEAPQVEIDEEEEKRRQQRKESLQLAEKKRRKKQDRRRQRILGVYNANKGEVKPTQTEENEEIEVIIRDRQKRRDEIGRLLEDGKTRYEIQQESGHDMEDIAADINYYRSARDNFDRKNNTNRKIESRRRKILALLNENMSVEEISERLNIPIAVVRRDADYLNANGKVGNKPKKAKQGRPSKREIVEKIKTLQEEGKGYGEIADELHLSISEVIIALQENEKDAKDISEARRKQIVDLWNEGKTLGEISRSLGVNVNLIMEDLLGTGVSKESIETEEERREQEERERKEREERERREQEERERKKQKIRELRNKGEEAYYVMMLQKIKIYIVRQDFDKVLEYIKMIESEVKLSEEEKNYLNQIKMAMQKRIRIEAEKKRARLISKKEIEDEGQRNEAEEAYYKMTLKEIKNYIVRQDFDKVLEYIKVLEGEVKLSGEEKKNLNQIKKAIQGKVKSKRESTNDDKEGR